MENMDLKPVKGIEKYAHDLIGRVRIFYKRKGYFAECTCSECGEKYVIRTAPTRDPFQDDFLRIEKPVKDNKAKCRQCGAKGIYKNAGKFKDEWYETNLIVGEKIADDKFVLRIFWVNQKIEKNMQSYYTCKEFKRIYLEKGKKPVRYAREYIWGDGYTRKWLKSTSGENYYCDVHPKTFKEIKKTGMFKYIPIPEEIKAGYSYNNWVRPFLITAARYPDMEMILKMGMYKLAVALMEKRPVNFNPRGRQIHDRLRIYKNRLPMVAASHGDTGDIWLFQTEKKSGKHWSDEEAAIIRIMYKSSTWTGDFNLLMKYTKPIPLKNYMEKQGIWYVGGDTGLRREYVDYIKMREEEGYDMTDEIILYPKNIHRRHEEMVLLKEKAKIDKRRNEVLRRFPKIAKNYKKLNDKYSAAAAGYIIRPAKDAAEIVDEGRILHHCVGGDTYLMKHSAGQSCILFLRKADKPDKPYITVEIKGEKIVQWYGAYDHKPNAKYFDAWLEAYTKELRERKPKKAVKTA